MMLISCTNYFDGLTVIRFKTRRLRPDALRFLDKACDQFKRSQRHGIILDFEGVRTTNLSSIGALVELLGRHPKLDFAFCNMNVRIAQLIQDAGLDRHLQIFPTIDAAFKSQLLQRHFLSETKAILDLSETSIELSKATGATTVAELDILGRPLVEHFLANLACFGMKEALICAPSDQLARARQLLDKIDHDFSLFFAPYALPSSNENKSVAPRGAYNYLDILQHNLPTDRPFLISSVNGLEKLKFRQIEERDTASEEAQSATKDLVKSQFHKDKTVHQFFTAEQFENRVKYAPNVHPLRAKETSVQVPSHRQPPRLGNIKSLNDYFSALRVASKNITTDLPPVGEEIAANVWRGNGAKISHRARLSGFCYIGHHATIEPEAALKSFSVIGAHAIVSRRSLLDESCVLAGRRTLPNQIYRNGFVGAREVKPLSFVSSAHPKKSIFTPQHPKSSAKLGAA
ncbi:MAG: STAS domain-containing protein [Cognatishimia activa]